MSTSEFNVSISIEALSEMSSIIKRLTSEVNTLRTKNEALEKKIQELTPKNTIMIGNSCEAVPPGYQAQNGSGGILYVVPETRTEVKESSFLETLAAGETITSSSDTSHLASLECQFCFKAHSKGKCEYERWMDVLADSVPEKPSAALKYVRIIHDEWVVVLVPDYYPVIVGETTSNGYAELDFEDLNNIATRKSLAHFKTLDRNIYSIIDNRSKVISEWICQQGFDNSF